MNCTIKVYKKIMNEIIRHCNINPDLECGGYLYGDINKKENDCIITLSGCYHDFTNGTENMYKFNVLRLFDLREELKSKHLIGCYHSHGKNETIFSDVDRDLQRLFFERYKIRAYLIYSPSFNNIVGEVITNSLRSYSARITLIDDERNKELEERQLLLSKKPSSNFFQL